MMIRGLFASLALTLAFTAVAPALAGETATGVDPLKVESPLIMDAPLTGDFLMGKKEAPLTIVEYASLSCPHCANFHNTVLPKLKQKYIDTGKVRLIVRPFPLNEPALKASMLVDCVGQDGGAERYYTFMKVLFDGQKQWAFDSNYMPALETFAKVGGLSKDQFDKCTNDPDREIKLLKVKKDANDILKVPHTPFFFLQDHPFNGEKSVEGFSAAIDQMLKEKQK
jgi:protein-disulfide isomerase